MLQIFRTQTIQFEAEVVAVFERGGRRVAKLMVQSFFVEVDAHDLAAAHLGDRVILHAGAGAPEGGDDRPWPGEARGRTRR